jgi:hypothetical protein
MKAILYIYCIFMAPWGFAQTFGPRQVINPEPSTVRMVRTADIDEDGDLDIVVAAWGFISWYENLDGQGTFGPAIAIQEGMGQSYNIFLAKIDDNNTIDIVVSYFDEGILAWYPNTGSGFGAIQIIATDFVGASGVTVNDLDGDDDNDVVFGISNGSGLYWFENLDGVGSFSSQIVIDSNIAEARTQAIGDIDGDGDMDVLTNSISTGTRVAWYENTDGQGSFSSRIIIDPNGAYESTINLADMDGDDDLDILSEKLNGTYNIIWRENLDGQGSFSSPKIVGIENSNILEVQAADLNNDNNLDVVCASTGDNKITWYENIDGLGTFGPQEIIDPSLALPRTVHAADLDGDGDLDVLSAALFNGDYDLVWYENLTILATNDIKSLGIKIYPNPVKELLVIESPITLQRVSIYSILGSKLIEVLENLTEISMAGLPNGILLVEITTEKGTVLEKVVKE